jgi:hypothetical protein
MDPAVFLASRSDCMMGSVDQTLHTMEENPYQSPRVTDDLPLGTATVIVDGNTLVVASGTVLPPICVRSGRSVDATNMVQRTLYWNRSFAPSRTCVLTYALHPDFRRQRYRPTILAGLLGGVAVAASFAWSANVAVLLLVLIASAAVQRLFLSPLHVVEYRQGMFRIKGFCPAFLERLQEILDRGDSDGIAPVH